MIDKTNIYNAVSEDYKRNTVDLSSIAWLGAGYAAKKIIYDNAANITTPIKMSSLRYLSGYGNGLKNVFGEHASVGHVAWNAFRGFEETLLQFPRAFSISSLYGAKILSSSSEPIHITYDEIKNQIKYLQRATNFAITDEMIKSAGELIYHKGAFRLPNSEQPLFYGKIYPGASFKGLKDRSGRDLTYVSRFSKVSYEKYGLTAPYDDILIHGAPTRIGAILETADTIFTNAMQNYMRLLDDPFEFLKDSITGFSKGSTRITKALDFMSKRISKYGVKNLFGVGGFTELKGLNGLGILAKHFKTGFPRLLAAYGIYKGVDWLMKSILPDDTVGGTGLKGVVAKAYQDATLLYSNISDATGLTYVTKAQEELAPGSTSLLSTIAFPLSFGIAGLTAGYFMDLFDKSAHPILGGEMPRVIAESLKSIKDSHVSGYRFVEKLGLETMGRKSLMGLIGAAIGVAVTLPLLPGKFGSEESSKELEQKYEGIRRVPVKSGRGWMFGLSPFEGEETMYYAPHWTVDALSMATENATTPEEFTGGGRILYPFAKLIDPYISEELMDRERPYAYWGAKDFGFGLLEEIASPLKQIIKPTILAHPEGLITEAGSSGAGTFDNQSAIDLSKWVKEPESPGSISEYANNIYTSTVDMLGIHGFMASAVVSNLLGVDSPFQPDALYLTSGNIRSASRLYWDQQLGDMFGANEALRRFNWHRPYGTLRVSSTIRNNQPSWMPEKFQTGDPYAKIAQGDIRLPGRGLESIYSELQGLDYEDYPDVYKAMILNDIVPDSQEFASIFTSAYNRYDELPDKEKQVLDEIIRERKEIRNPQFDYGDSPLGAYYLALKKLGRSLPTESLYPIAPIHKFAGPVDPATEYKDKFVLDTTNKDWASPVSSFIVPAINKTIDDLSVFGYIPPSANESYERDVYFQAMQKRKNDILEERAKEYDNLGDKQIANWLRLKKMKTIYDIDITASADEIVRSYSPSKRKILRGLINEDFDSTDSNNRYLTPDLRYIAAAQQSKLEQGIPIEQYVPGPSIGESIDIQVPESELPDKDYITYAPGVNLNAFKVKLLKREGESVRQNDLWKKDEIEAEILSDIDDYSNSFLYESETVGHSIERNMLDAGFIPNIARFRSSFEKTDLYIMRDDKNDMKKHLRENGWTINNGGFY